MTFWRATLKQFAVLAVALAMATGIAAAQEASPSPGARQSLDDAWWTGPMLAPSAATLPRGHFLIEPYLYDVIGAHSNGIGSLTYINYGLRDRFTVGLIPTGGFNKVSNGLSSSSLELGDVTAQAQYKLLQFHQGSWIPTTSIAVQETFPIGKYDRLGDRPSDGFGSGAYTTTVALYTQDYFWLPNGRILRMRFNVAPAFSSHANVQDLSVYGTITGFRGRALPGSTVAFDASWEYSATRKWVLALDATYRHAFNTRTTGMNVVQGETGIRLNSGSSDSFGFAPAIEYSWKSNLGVLLGTRVIPASHDTSLTVTPAVAINYVH